MHMSMGIDSTKFTREAMPAALRARAFCSSVAATMPRIFFWFGQITPQTLSSMIVPSHAPMPITTNPEWNVKALTKFSLRSHAPPSQVASAAQRNQNRARGATYFVTPAPPGDGQGPTGQRDGQDERQDDAEDQRLAVVVQGIHGFNLQVIVSAWSGDS